MATPLPAAVAPTFLSHKNVSGKQQVEEPHEETRVLSDANALLEKIGFGARKFERFEDLVASVSSMSVALYEKLFQFRLEDIVRVPQNLEDYERNAQVVVDALSGALLEKEFDTLDVTGESLCAGHVDSIRQILRMFEQIDGILEEANRRGEHVQLATPPPSQTAASLLSNATTTAKSLPKKKKPTKKKKKKSSLSGSRGQLNASMGSSDDESEDNDVGKRAAATSTRLQTHMSSLSRAMRGDVNIYETSTTSIMRRRQDLSGGRRSDKSKKSGEVRTENATRSQASSTPLSASVVHNLDGSFASIRKHSTIKKRSRLLNQSFEAIPGHRERRREEDQPARSNGVNSKHHHKTAAVDPDLLETQKYGRFVPVATPLRTRKYANSHPGSSTDEEEGQRRSDADDKELDGDEEQMYFGGVSSVSNASGSEKSVHFIDEDDDDDDLRDFSSVDIQNVPPNGAAATSPSNAYDDNVNAKEIAKDKTVASKTTAKKSSTNQQEVEETPTATSPVKKKVARNEPKSAPELSAPSRGLKRDPASSLYPLLPGSTRHATTSKSHTEYMRYKLYLKDHLQDLRQREYCQRQHLERAYKVGEHTANVEKIRARRFQQDIRLQRISVGLESRNEEEKHLRNTLHHILQLEKEKLRDEHRTTSTILKQIQKDHAEREKSMETFYSNQIQLVKEQTHREVKERELVEKAHRLASEQMMREMRKERESQIAALLQEKQHLEEARRFRTTSSLSQALEKGDKVYARASQSRADAFYVAAMKARQLSSPSTAKKKSAKLNAIYSNRAYRAAPMSKRVK